MPPNAKSAGSSSGERRSERGCKARSRKARGSGDHNQEELQTLSKLFEVGLQDFGKGSSAEKAYNEARRIFDEMLASGNFGATALALAAAETNSYLSIDGGEGTITVVYKKSNWETRLAVVGAGIGAQLAPGWGGPLGAAVGGAVGAAIDECID